MTVRHYGRRPMSQRERLEAAVAAAIEILDTIDGDLDREPDGDGEKEPGEHSFGPVSLDRILVEDLRP